MDFFVIQFLNGLASASSLFLVAAGLSIIFGVSRIVNFAHGSLYMLGAYLAYTLVKLLPSGPLGFWGGIILAALAIALIGAVVEIVVLRRIYRAPELLQLLATFGLVLIVQDLVLMIWGAEDLFGPRPPGMKATVQILGHPFAQYSLILIALAPAVLAGLWLLLYRTRWGVLIRAATADREMVAALGVNQAWLFTSVFALGSLLAGLGGALQLPREPVNHAMDLAIVVEAFVVVVVGGLGSVPGAFLAAILIGELDAFGILVFPKLTLVFTFLAMALILVLRPSGLMGRVQAPVREAEGALARSPQIFNTRQRYVLAGLAVVLLALPMIAGNYTLSVGAEILIFAIFAASLHFVMGTGGMVSFGHAAYFGLGSYGAALLVHNLGWPMMAAIAVGPLLAGAGALVFGAFCVRLSGVYLAMLTLAVAEIAYAVATQWDAVTGGDNGLIGIWPSAWAASPTSFYYLSLAATGIALAAIRWISFAPFGYTLRGCRDSKLRADAIGINFGLHRWLGFGLGGLFAGIAGALYAFLKGSVFPETAGIELSVDGLVMVLLGGIQTMVGPVAGAFAYKTLRIVIGGYTERWHMVVGAVILMLIIAAPQGIVGWFSQRRRDGA